MIRWLDGLLPRPRVPSVPPPSPHQPPGRHVLMLAYYYPPHTEIGAARPYRFAHYLRRLGTMVSVISSLDTIEPGVVREPALRGGRRVRAMARALQALERLVLPYYDRVSWLPHACTAAAAIMTPGTVLISTHPPVVVHLAALMLKWRFGRPWIADFRDPLWGNPFRIAYRASLIDPIIERLVLRHADAVIANTDTSAAMLISRYPAYACKISTIWNGFDPEDRLQPLPRSEDRARRVISHVGSLYGARTPLLFVACLNRLIASDAISPGAIQFRQIGKSDPDCLDLANAVYRSLQIQGCLHALTHALPQDEARYEMLTADWLLLLDVNATNPGLQAPAKIFEYIQACRPILALTTPGSPTERILARSGVAYACVDIAADPAQFDAEVLAFLRRPFSDMAPSAQFWSEFDGRRQTAVLSVLIDQVCAVRSDRLTAVETCVRVA